MSIDKLRIMPLLLALAFLCACAPEGSLAAAELLDAAAIDAGQHNYDLISLEERPVIKDYATVGRLTFPRDTMLFMDEETKLVAIHTGNYTRVSKGDLLAELEYDRDKAQTEIALIDIQIKAATADYAIQEKRSQLAREELERRIERELIAPQRAVLRKELEREKLSLEHITRQHELKLSELGERRAEEAEKMGVIRIYAPHDGYVYNITGKSKGDILAREETVLRIFDPSVYQVRITAGIDNFYYNMPVSLQIPRGPQLTGRIVSDPMSTDKSSTSLLFYIRLDEELEDPYSVSSLDIPITAQSQVIESARVLPISAVKMEEDRRYVTILEDGIIKKRYVKLGLFNRDYAQILYGIEDSDLVFRS